MVRLAVGRLSRIAAAAVAGARRGPAACAVLGPSCGSVPCPLAYSLPCFAVCLVGAATRTILAQLQPVRIVPAVLLRVVVTASAAPARQREVLPVPLGHGSRSSEVCAFATILAPTHGYSLTWVTTPAPTVRPPSRMAKRSPSSIAIGVINSMSTVTLSPGITISVPAGSVTTPVTSVVRT